MEFGHLHFFSNFCFEAIEFQLLPVHMSLQIEDICVITFLFLISVL